MESNERGRLERVEAWMREGRMDEAREEARSRDTREIQDPALHIRWADLLEELGLFEEVILELNLALRDDPDSAPTLERLAETLLDQDQPKKAARCWARLLRRYPDNPAYYESLGRVLEEAGDYERALKIYQGAFERTKDERFQALARALDFLKGEEEAPESVDRPDVLVPASHHLVTFLSLFSGREGVYARQWVSPTGESGYTPVHEPFTLKVAEQHITGALTAGIYPVRLDNTVSFIAFDVDMARFAVRDTVSRESAWKKTMALVHKAACRLVDAGAAMDLPVYLEDSGFKGRHAWIFLDIPVPAGVARKCANLLLQQVGALPREVTVEVFPKQSTVRPGALGNLIKLPLGIHKKTGRRALFIQPDGTEYPAPLDFLENVVKAARRSVYAAIQRMGKEGSRRTVLPVARDTSRPAPAPFAETVLEPVEEPYDPDRDPQLQLLVLKCFVIRSILERVAREATLSREEAQVLIHSVGHLEHGPEAVNRVFEQCVNADPSLFMKSRLRGNPVSCPKIRARVPHITAQGPCNCRFDPSHLYPSPLNHLRDADADRSGPVAVRSIESLQFQNLLEEYLQAQKRLREIRAQIERCEQRLHAFFEQAGVEEMRTPLGTLRRLRKEDQTHGFALEI